MCGNGTKLYAAYRHQRQHANCMLNGIYTLVATAGSCIVVASTIYILVICCQFLFTSVLNIV